MPSDGQPLSQCLDCHAWYEPDEGHKCVSRPASEQTTPSRAELIAKYAEKAKRNEQRAEGYLRAASKHGEAREWAEDFTVFAAEARLIAAALRDAERLDELERVANEAGGIHLHNGSHTGCTGLGLSGTGRTLRQAVDDIRCARASVRRFAGATPPAPDAGREELFEDWYERLRRERGCASGPMDSLSDDALQMLLAAYYDRSRFLAASPEPDAEREPCKWMQDDEFSRLYGTACGHMFEFNEGPPSENHAAFCLYCGGNLVEVPWPDDADEDPAASPAPSSSGGAA